MGYISLYRRFRPDSFEKVIGQNHIIKTLINQIKNDRINHSYLFTGSRGTGKTTCAKIFAKAVNCLNPINGSPCHQCSVCIDLAKPGNIDIIEIDAASNNGVDEIRQLKENIQYRPTVGRYKVYIIDEVHMLSVSAFNALLKTLEEPPEHIIFILATTEVQKLPATILSRCLRFDFRLISTNEIANLIGNIFDDIKVNYENKAIQQIAIFGEGSARDAISIADMCMSYCDDNITLKGVLEVLGASDFNTIHELGKAILLNQSGQALTVLDKLYNDGRSTIHKDLCNYFRDLLSIKNVKAYKLDSVTEEQAKLLKDLADDIDNYRVNRAMEIMVNIESALRYSSQPRILLEATIVKACQLILDQSTEATFARIKELEKKIERMEKQGVFPSKQVSLAVTNVEVAQEEDITSELELNAVETSDNTLFEETINYDDEKAYSAWDGIISRLNQKGESTLCVVASKITEGIRLEGNNLIINTSDTATINLFNEKSFFETLRNCVKEELGQEYNFICQKELASTEKRKEGITQLKDLFGTQLKIKK